MKGAAHHESRFFIERWPQFLCLEIRTDFVQLKVPLVLINYKIGQYNAVFPLMDTLYKKKRINLQYILAYEETKFFMDADTYIVRSCHVSRMLVK